MSGRVGCRPDKGMSVSVESVAVDCQPVRDMVESDEAANGAGEQKWLIVGCGWVK